MTESRLSWGRKVGLGVVVVVTVGLLWSSFFADPGLRLGEYRTVSVDADPNPLTFDMAVHSVERMPDDWLRKHVPLPSPGKVAYLARFSHPIENFDDPALQGWSLRLEGGGAVAQYPGTRECSALELSPGDGDLCVIHLVAAGATPEQLRFDGIRRLLRGTGDAHWDVNG